MDGRSQYLTSMWSGAQSCSVSLDRVTMLTAHPVDTKRAKRFRAGTHFAQLDPSMKLFLP